MTQWFWGQVGPILGLLKCSFFHHKYFFIKSMWQLQHISELLPPVHGAGMLQACCRPSRNLTIGVKSNWCKRKTWNIFFSKLHYFFCLKLQTKRNLFLKDHWENFTIWGVTKQTKMNFMNKQRFFSMLCLGKKEIRVEKKVYLLLLHLPSKSFPKKLSGTGFVFLY